ncbi:hypothetical protein IQ06DRAFT_319233 [Phaeosphaeriaceae sp. SRC1lsM3a]|nr:hypothetical protein IQ06DRAFT_319233 [Stagonospora sp. SRC1lsM3a]
MAAVPTPASDSEAPSTPQAQSPLRQKLPAPSTPASSVRRKMASNAASAAKESAPPRRPTASSASGTATVGARRPTASTTTPTARASTSASRPTTSTTSRVSTVGSSLNKPPTRPAPGSSSIAREDDVEAVNCALLDHHRRSQTAPDHAHSRRCLNHAAVYAHSRRCLNHAAVYAHITGSVDKDHGRTTVDHDHEGSNRSSPIHVPPRSNGLLKDKAASDAEAENRRSALAPVKAALAKLGEETQRPDTAPSGPAEMDIETKRRSAQIMQDFFKETNLREQLQDQCDDLAREVDNLQSEKEKLKKQLLDAEAAIAEKDKAIAGATGLAGADDSAHETKIDEMGRNQKLEEEKQAEATKAAELQQVLDDLNEELERQGQDERDALAEKVETAQNTLETLQTKITELEQSKTTELHSRDEKVADLTRTVEELRAETEASQQRHSEALQDANRSLETKSSESAKLVEDLQSQVKTLQQQHTDELPQEELQNDLTNLQQRADQATADLESERTAHAEEIQKKIDELQQRADDDLRSREEEVSGHLKSIDGLQEQIAKLQQGETDGANIAQELSKQIEELKQSHDAALKIKTDENDELVQQLDAINDQLSADATEIEQLRDEAEGLRKTISTLEQVSQQESSQHASELAKLRAELNAVTKKSASQQAELKHEIDANDRLGALQTNALEQFEKASGEPTLQESSGSASKDLTDARDKAKQLEEEKIDLQSRVEALTKENAIDEAHAKSQTIIDKTTAEESHARALDALKQKSDKEAHGMSKTIIADLQARHDDLLQEKTTAEDAHSRAIDALKQDSESTAKQLLGELQSNTEGAHKTELEDLQIHRDTTHESVVSNHKSAQESHSKALDAQQVEIEQKYASLLDTLQEDASRLEKEKATALSDKQAALNELVALKKELHAEIDALRNELGSKDETEDDHQAAVVLLKEELKEQHESALFKLQSEHDSLQHKLATIDKDHGDAIELLKEDLTHQLETLQKQHKDLTEQKAAMDQAHEEAISELMMGMESSQSDAVQQLQKNHAAEIESFKQVSEAEIHAQEVKRLQEAMEGMQKEHSQTARTVADTDASAQELQTLRKALEDAQAERDEATMKGEVVRKHLARVEPLEKENAALFDKIDRLEAIIAAGDRVARAAATLGEKRDIDTLAEEDEEEEDSEDAATGAQQQLAAMQETLNQLSELNNDAIAESSRTAQRLTEQD